jgi:hypothetical protein
VAPSFTVASWGSEVITGAAGSTERIAGRVLVALPATLETTTVNWAWSSASVAAATTWDEPVAPGMSAPFLLHW